MNPTDEDFRPRRDGWFEHRGTWEEVVVGTVLGTEKRSERWEVIATAMGRAPIPYGFTPWIRVREQTTGEERTLEPRNKTFGVTILTQDPADTKTGDPVPPTDADAIMLLVKELGAEPMASRDNVTGEIVCPDYASGRNHLGHGPGELMRGEIEHLKFAHGIEVDPDISIVDLATVHGQAHHKPVPSEHGFAHRHVPEDLTLYTGKRSV